MYCGCAWKWDWPAFLTRQGMKKDGHKEPLPAAMELLARNYEKILSEVGSSDRAVGFLEVQDAVQETALHIVTDRAVLESTSDEEFVRLFMFRFRMFRFRIHQNFANEKKRHANYFQAQEEE